MIEEYKVLKVLKLFKKQYKTDYKNKKMRNDLELLIDFIENFILKEDNNIKYKWFKTLNGEWHKIKVLEA